MKTVGGTDYTNLVPLKCCGRTDGQTDGRPDGRSGPTTRPAFAKATQVTMNKRKCNTTISLPISVKHIIRGPYGGLSLVI